MGVCSEQKSPQGAHTAVPGAPAPGSSGEQWGS